MFRVVGREIEGDYKVLLVLVEDKILWLIRGIVFEVIGVRYDCFRI